jgi:hypothetical protein
MPLKIMTPHQIEWAERYVGRVITFRLGKGTLKVERWVVGSKGNGIYIYATKPDGSETSQYIKFPKRMIID